MKKVISTPVPAAGPYSQAIQVGDFIFCSGQIPVNPQTGEVITDNIRDATARCLENLSAILKSYESSLEDVVKTTVYLTNESHFAAMNEVYGRYFPTLPPARSTVVVSCLPRGVEVEIEAIAISRKPKHG